MDEWSCDPRPLTKAEDDAVRFLLSTDFSGVEALRTQLDDLRVVGGCGCGCATVYLRPDMDRSSPSHGPQGPVVADAKDLAEAFQLMLFLEDGWLSALEITTVTEYNAPEIPSPDRFHPPDHT